jgi:ATP-dependent Clp protease ATP-binding subunit ClpB
VDDIVVFHGLKPEDLQRIVEIQLERIRERLEDRQIVLEVTPDALRHLAEVGYDPVYGARPLKRLLQREIETRLGRKILAGEVTDRSRVKIDWNGTELQFDTVPLVAAA